MKLLKHFKGYRLVSFMGAFFKLIEVVLQLLIPLTFRYMINEGLIDPSPDHQLLWIAFSVMFALIILSFICSLTGQYFSSKASAGVGMNIRREMYQKVASFSFRELDKFSTTSLTNRLTTDIEQFQKTILMTLRLILRVPGVVVGGLVVIFLISYKFALVLIALIPFVIALLYGIMVVSRKLYRKINNARDGFTKVARENARGARVVRAFTKEENEYHRFSNENEVYEHTHTKLAKISSITAPIVAFLMNIALVIMYALGGNMVNIGSIAYGDLTILQTYSTEIVNSLILLVDFIIILSNGRAAYERIKEVLETNVSLLSPVDGKTIDPNTGIRVSFKDVSFVYDEVAEIETIDDVSFEIAPHETFGITGLTGSGKTSLINLIPRFYDPNNGSILINGVDVKAYDLHSLRQNITFISQTPDMIRGTIESNLSFGRTYSPENLFEKIIMSGSLNIIENKHAHLQERVHGDGRNFSLGQKQRLSLARGLLRQNQLLILDDSFSALDYETNFKIQQALKNDQLNPTTIIVSQNIKTLQGMNRILVLDEGRVEAIGTHDELLKISKTYQTIARSQGIEVAHEN